MSDQNSDQDPLHSVVVTSTTSTVMMKRTVRVTTGRGDEFRTGESSETWTLARRDGSSMTPPEAFNLSLAFTPQLMRKVLFDLVVMGVMNREEAIRRNTYARDAYSTATKQKVNDAVKGSDSPDISGTGDIDSPVRKEPPEGVSLSPGEDGGLSQDARPSN